MRRLVVAMVVLMASTVAAAAAQNGGNVPAPFDGPATPAAPATVARDAQGHTTVRAQRLTAPLRIDGRVDEPIYSTVDAISDFIQMDPAPGTPAIERTEAWIFFDDSNMYVTMRAWETQPERRIAKEMRRDSNNIRQGDCLAFGFDTFFDKQTAFYFEVNPLGAFVDSQTTDRQVNSDWNVPWKLAVARFAGGWSFEAAVPFDVLRYKPGRDQVWGVQLRRYSRWRNEISFLTKVPPSLGLGRGSIAASLFATLVGIEAPAPGVNLEVKPYATANMTTDRNASPSRLNDLGANAGLDVKYAVTQNLTADVTLNTDFAQVEADEQQVNLTRFNLLFPEKREFFLENRDVFTFGGVAGLAGGLATASGDAPIVFYSRRIGLVGGQDVPIQGGGRLTGRVGRFSIGALNLQTGDDLRANATSTNFAVVRVKRDILRRSSVGALFTRRSLTENRNGTNEAVGVDGTFTFFNLLSLAGYWARTRTDGLRGDDTSYRATGDFNGDRYGLQVERLVIGDHFNPDVGFVRRHNMRQNWGQARFSPRLRSSSSIRKLSWIGTYKRLDNGAKRLETQELDGEFGVEFQNGDRFFVGAGDRTERLVQPFRIAPAVTIPTGLYRFAGTRVGYNLGLQRRVSGNLLFERGRFYDGERTALTFRPARVNPTAQVSIEPSASINWVELPSGSFTQTLVGPRVTYTLTPRLFASALLQYNSTGHVVSSNLRVRWEYQPGSEFFVVYNEERDTLTRNWPGLENRSIIVKINKRLRL